MTGARRTTPYLFQHWDGITDRIEESRRLVIFIDFDGTLVPVAPMPDRVRLADRTRRILERLSRRRMATVVVISGRQRAELLRYVRIRNIKYLGLYGWECNGNARLPSFVRGALDRALTSLQPVLARYPKVWIEPKSNSFSVHLLGASAEIQRRVRKAVRTKIKPLRETLQVFANLRDVEVAPVMLGDKGVAVRRFLDDPSLWGALPVYFGDDFSDEPGFAATRRGISVLVGERWPTRAQFFLRGPQEVAVALSRMEASLR